MNSETLIFIGFLTAITLGVFVVSAFTSKVEAQLTALKDAFLKVESHVQISAERILRIEDQIKVLTERIGALEVNIQNKIST